MKINYVPLTDALNKYTRISSHDVATTARSRTNPAIRRSAGLGATARPAAARRPPGDDGRDARGARRLCPDIRAAAAFERRCRRGLRDEAPAHGAQRR